MRKNLLLLFALFMMTSGLTAQFVVINSPEDCAGALEFGEANAWGAFLADSVWTGDLVLVNDGTALPTEGCDPLVNGTDVAGNFALIDRGSCEFGQKALNAEMAGATAVVIANHTPGAGVIDLGAGAQGGLVTIPVIMINFEDGQMIKDKLAGGETVNMSIGDIRFANDLSITLDSLVFPPYGTVPSSQMDQSGDFVFTPGGVVVNKGTEGASNVNLSATIDYSGSEVYNESTALGNMDSNVDSTVLLPAFEPSSGEGVYEFTYSVAGDSTDQADFDNTFTSNFTVSDNVYCKGRWDAANNRPVQTNAYTIAGGGNIEMLTPFEFPSGDGYMIDSVQFYVSTSSPTLAGVSIFLYVYLWEDADGDGGVVAEEVSLAAFGVHEFDNTVTETGTWVTAPIEDLFTAQPGYVIPGDGARIWVGTRYEGSELVFFGFDEGYDLYQYLDKVTTPGGTFNDAQRPYLQTQTFGPAGADFDDVGFFTDTWVVSATALHLDEVVSNNDLTASEATINVYPNPSTDYVILDIELAKLNNRFLSYEIVDMMGRSIYRKALKDVSQNQHKFDVSHLASGTYEIIIKADDGITNKRFIVD